jgi:hypothetical protein
MPFVFKRIHVSELAVKASVSKIKSKPIQIIIDEIIIEMEEPSIVLPPRNGPVPPGPPAPESAPHKYALGDRIGDGISVRVNRVLVVIKLKVGSSSR